MAKGTEDLIRVVVSVRRDAHPEIFEELAGMASYYRAERIRSLLTSQLSHLLQPGAAPGQTWSEGSGRAARGVRTSHTDNEIKETPPRSQEDLKQQELTKKKQQLSKNFQFE